MNRPALALLALVALTLATPSATLAHGGLVAHRGDRIDQHLDRRGDRIDHRLDRRADIAAAHGHPVRAETLDRRGDRIDRHLDRRGDRLERRADRIGHPHHTFRRG